MAQLEVQSNLKCITSGNVPTTENLLDGEFAFGNVGGEPKLYGNVDGTIVDFSGDITIDADTLNGLLSGGNGIEIVKNTAGDKVEVKINNEGFTLGDQNPDSHSNYANYGNSEIYLAQGGGSGGVKLNRQSVSLIDGSGAQGVFADTSGISRKVYNSDNQLVTYAFLHENNVKTIGGQSIYGSGDIPVGGGSVSLPIVFSGVSQGMSSADGSIIDATYTEGYPGAPMIKLKYLDYVNSISPINIYMKQTSSGHTHELYVHGGGITYVFDDTQYAILREDNVKTLFGNQSIYGSGNIDLYIHIITARFSRDMEKYTEDTTLYIVVPSSSSTRVNSLTDLFTLLQGKVDLPVKGDVRNSTTRQIEAIVEKVDSFSSNGIIKCIKFDGSTYLINISDCVLSHINDNVTTV